MTEPDEQRLADALAGYLDGTSPPPPGLQPEIETLLAIDGALDPPAPIPDYLSGHKILREIGSGGMGIVLLASDERLGRDVAVKMLTPRFGGSPELKTRFMHEARAMARITHPNIARIYSLGPADEPPHFVMEHIEGAPLTRAAAKLEFRQKAELMQKVALATAFLHENGIIHRDLKPANILVTPDLEPKLLDFGLALDTGPAQIRLSLAGEIVGTPEYLSPEQTHAARIDARSDVFSLGAILYELLCGVPPFSGAAIPEIVQRIREHDPELPTRRNPAVPRELQNICLKALEKVPGRRYQTARELAGDLQRYLAGEPVHAEPGAYSRIISRQIERHLDDVEGWRRDKIISDAEYDAFRRRYDRLAERDDAWIMEARRLTLPQVILYLGVWILSVAAALLAVFRYPGLTGAPAVLAAWTAALPTIAIGVAFWRRGRLRVAIAFLLGFCLLLPLAALVSMEEFGWFAAFTHNRKDLELFSRLDFPKAATNARLWWALLASLPAAMWLRRFTRASVFTLAFAFLASLFCLAGLLRMGAVEWLEKDPGRFYFQLLPYAALFLAGGFFVERLRHAEDSRYLYPFAILFTWTALTGVVTFHQPYADWLLHAAPWTRGQLEYLFILNAAVYFALDRVCDLLSTPQVRMVGRAFRFVIPGHVLTSLLLLGLSASEKSLLTEARLLEWLLPAAAIVFVFAGIPRQMKNFFASGLLFLAIGIVRLQRDYFKDQSLLPIVLVAAGLSLMLAAAYYAPLRIRLVRLFRKKSRA